MIKSILRNMRFVRTFKAKILGCKMNTESKLHEQLQQVLGHFKIDYSANHWDNTPMGEEWNAEFVFTHPKTQQPMVIQTLWFDDLDGDLYEEAIQKAIEQNKLYLDSGYKTLWFVETPEDDDGDIRELLQDHQYASMPMFYFKKFDANEPIFYVGGWRSNAERDNQIFFDMSAPHSGLGVKKYFDHENEVSWFTLRDFFAHFFVGGIRWSLDRINTALTLALVERECWKCKTPQNLIKRVNIVGYPFPKQQDIKVVLHYSPLEQAPLDPELIGKLNSLEMRQKYNYGLIAMRYSKTIKDEYLSTGCVSCGALQGQHFIDRIIMNPQDYTHTELLDTGELITDQETYETMGEWILVQNEFLELHQSRPLNS